MIELLSSENFITQTVNTYSDTIYRIALHITNNREDSFDVCQEVFLRLVKNKEKIKSEQHLKAWLIRTAVNCSKSTKTQAYNRYTVPIEDVSPQSLVVEQKGDDTISSVMKLPEKYRMVIYFYYYQELSIAEISDVLKITNSAVKSRLSRGRKLLKEILREEETYE